jgi:taurine dioxygenase
MAPPLPLYAVSGSSFGIEGMPDDEALDLLRELAAHATQEAY